MEGGMGREEVWVEGRCKGWRCKRFTCLCEGQSPSHQKAVPVLQWSPHTPLLCGLPTPTKGWECPNTYS